MSYYGNLDEIRSNISGGLVSGDQNFKGTDQISNALIVRGQRWSTSIINSYLEKPYPEDCPWASGGEPALIFEVANELSEYFVRSKTNPTPNPLTKDVTNLYKNNIDILSKLANYELEMTGLENPLGDSASYTHSDYSPTMGLDPIEGQHIDNDLIDDTIMDRD